MTKENLTTNTELGKVTPYNGHVDEISDLGNDNDNDRNEETNV